jgi:uncharacterized protein with GYD domain
MYRAGIEGILGIRREGLELVIAPCIPDDWPGFEAVVHVDGTRYDIRVTSRALRGVGMPVTLLDGDAWPAGPGGVRVPLDGKPHILQLIDTACPQLDAVRPGTAAPPETAVSGSAPEEGPCRDRLNFPPSRPRLVRPRPDRAIKGLHFEEHTMAIYITLSSFTDRASRRSRTPSSVPMRSRRRPASTAVAAEHPLDSGAIRHRRRLGSEGRTFDRGARLAIAQAGNVSTQTLRAFSRDEMSAILAKL